MSQTRTLDDYIALLRDVLQTAMKGDNLVPLLVDGVIVLVAGFCTLGVLFPALLLGYAQMCLRITRGETVAVGDSLKGTERFGAALVLGLLWLLAVALGSMVLGVGALVAMFFLNYAFYVMADRPERGAVDCAKASFDLTMAHLADSAVLFGVSLALGAVLGPTVLGAVVAMAFSTLLGAVMYRAHTG